MIRYVPIKRWVTVRFDEGLRLSDLAKDVGMSDFTSTFSKERKSIMGPDVKNIKLVYMEIDDKEDSVLFQFTTPATDKYEKGYKYKATNPDADFKLVTLPSKKYTMEIKILSFFELLETAPGDITNKDIEDVLKVADVQVWCDCASQVWQGNAYYLSLFDASVYKISIAPKHWNNYHNNGDNLLCKHLSPLIFNIGFFIPQMRQKLLKEILI